MSVGTRRNPGTGPGLPDPDLGQADADLTGDTRTFILVTF